MPCIREIRDTYGRYGGRYTFARTDTGPWIAIPENRRDEVWLAFDRNEDGDEQWLLARATNEVPEFLYPAPVTRD